ncbi:MAG: FkbM family methyltransferase [Phycisphaerae bacterium]
MRFGVFGGGWWEDACRSFGYQAVALPRPRTSSGNSHAADLASRVAAGSDARSILTAPETGFVDLLLDNGGAGLTMLPPTPAGHTELLHEHVTRPLISHFIDPMVTVFQGLDWGIVWASLQSPTWGKGVWDRAQVHELQQFGVPNVFGLRMAAPVRAYDTQPLNPARCRPVVSFVGAQNTSYFAQGAGVPAGNLFPGVLAAAVHGDLPRRTFFDIYHSMYGLGSPVTPEDTLATAAQKTLAYYQAKLFYNASLCIRNRDRFVIFLKKHLGDGFELIGRRWDTTYGLPCRPPIPTDDEYFQHFREVAINLNLVNGNAETGVNMRHFEVTAAGGFLMCYDQPEIHDCFEVGKECVVFGSEVDLLEKVKYYLHRPQERVAIAHAGQRRTLAQHLYSHRLQEILRTFGIRPMPVAFSSAHWCDDLQKLVPHPDVVLDCGANTGQTASGLRRLYPRAEIYSFEPVGKVFDELKKNCAPLNVHPVKKAVADQDGTTTINLTTSPEANSLFEFQEGNPCQQWTCVVGKEEVEVCTIDQWCHDSGINPGRVDVIKLDVQGAELKALAGAREVLKTAKAVYAEVAFVPIYKDIPLIADIDRFMADSGFRRHATYPSDQPHNWGDALYVRSEASR